MAADVFQCPQCSESIVLVAREGEGGFVVSVTGEPGTLLERLPKNWKRHPCALWGEPAVKARRR